MVAPVTQLNPAAALDAPAASAAATAASPLAGLQPGDVIAARVMALLENDQVQLLIGNTVVGATTQVPLPLGATVQLAVQTVGTATTLQFVGQTAPQAAAAAQTAAVQSVAAHGTAVPQAGVLPPAASLPAPRPPAEAIAVPAAGGAPGGISGSADLPAVASVVATTAVTDATALAALQELPLTAPQLAPALAADPTVALQAAVRTAAATQGSLAPLFAEIAAAVNLPALPEAVQREAMRLLSLRPQLDGNLAAADLKQAFTNSGLFLEAQLAESAQPSAGSSANAPAGAAAGAASSGAETAGGAATAAAALPQADLKAALMVFRQVLAMALAQGESPTAATATAAVPSGVATPPAAPQAVEVSSPTSRAAPSAPPPYRDGPTSAQPPAIATIDVATPPHEAVKTLTAATDGALARQTLLQAASLPGQPGGPNHIDNGGPRWHFEVPFATPQGTNVAQFEISRDGKAATPAGSAAPAWQARFSIDVDPIGPVHAQIALRGAHAAVTLWAERPEGAARLRAGAAKLTDALRAADLDAGDLVVRDGAPRTRAMPAGHFLDRAS